MTQPKIQGFTSLSALLIWNLIFFSLSQDNLSKGLKFYTSQPPVLELAEPLGCGKKSPQMPN